MITKNFGTLELLEEKLYELEKKKIAYLEVDDKAGARRITKQIERIELEKDSLDLDRLKKEFNVYKNVVRNYPSILSEINRHLSEFK